ncbi:MAG: hypothetical protein ABSF83_09355 [Nitrososphaerales archaeon]
MRQETPLAGARELSSSALRRSVYLASGYDSLRVDPDGSVGFLHSAKAGGLLFGRGAVEPFKIQAGVIVSQRQREMRVRLAPGSVAFSTVGPEAVQAYHLIGLRGREASGYARSARYSNRSDAGLRLRVLTLQDPTSLNYRLERDPPGTIGVNAFNRGDHVVMDDVGDTTGVRVVGFSRPPTKVYLTRSRQRAAELLSLGELPDSTAGMSGPILVLAQHDAELPPGGTFELGIVSLYHASSLEAALSEFKAEIARGGEGAQETGSGRPLLRSSSPAVNFAYEWARDSLGSVEREGGCSLDRLSAAFGVGVLRPERFESDFQAWKLAQRRDGLLPHSRSPRAGPYETSLFVIRACGYLWLARDGKRLARRWYPSLRRAGNALCASSARGLIVTPAGSPDGWRRRLGSGFPTGSVSEVNLVAAGALADLSSLSRWLGKTQDASAFRSAGARVLGSVAERLRVIETGDLALNLDARGRLHTEATVDQAVGLRYSAMDRDLASSVAHRLLERDFDTGYGPRTVSHSNALYYSPDYGEGQLGGCWTRASLDHAMLCYASGNPAAGSAQLEKVSTLVHSGAEGMGGAPGEFPYWFDPDRRRVGSSGSDPVAASNLIECLLVGELGMRASPEGVSFRVPGASSLRWVLLRGLRPGDGDEKGALFVGRAQPSPSSSSTPSPPRPPPSCFVASSLDGAHVEGAISFQRSERLELPEGLEGALFRDRGSLVACVGNASGSPVSVAVRVPARDPLLSTALFADLAELDQASGTWMAPERRRLTERMDHGIELGPGAWSALRISPVSAAPQGGRSGR